MSSTAVKSAYESLRERVSRVAALHRKCAVTLGAGRLVWLVGVPLLVVIAVQRFVGLPFWIRLPVLPLAIGALVYLAWKLVVRPLATRYSPTQAALLVEKERPQLNSRLVSAIELYPDLEASEPRFHRSMVQALVVHTQDSTQHDDFTAVIDRRPARRQVLAGAATLGVWVLAFALVSGMMPALVSMATAWGEVRNIWEKVTGAHIDIAALDRPAYLKGETVTLRAAQQGFHRPVMTAFVRNDGAEEWKPAEVPVSPDGSANFRATDVTDTFEIYFASGRIESERRRVIVTERPRITSLTVEYELPEYTRRAPIVQQRADGNLETVYGSVVVLTIKANKPLKTGTLTLRAGAEAGSAVEREERLNISGEYARAILRLDRPEWRASAATIERIYHLTLGDEYDYTNEDAAHAYRLAVTIDQAPKIAFVNLPHRTSADEPHLLESNLASLAGIVQASDDQGIAKITLHYRLENLETGATKDEGRREQAFALPRAEIPQLAMLRFNELGATAGDRIVFWAEAEDAYNLDPDTGPHRFKTPAFRIAVVSQEEMFSEVVYRDDWSTQWYDSLKVATLTKREIPPRQSPEREPSADVAKKLLDAPSVTDNLQGADKQLVQEYFESLNVMRKP